MAALQMLFVVVDADVVIVFVFDLVTNAVLLVRELAVAVVRQVRRKIVDANENFMMMDSICFVADVNNPKTYNFLSCRGYWQYICTYA